ncbi:MAG: hypothetical protein Q7J85_09800 [Bacillota bacterium]|nr:hypothetical protein [Bacillota bacterium]
MSVLPILKSPVVTSNLRDSLEEKLEYGSAAYLNSEESTIYTQRENQLIQ